MVAITQLIPRPERPAQPDERTGALVRLKALHAEAEETARLANLLGRSMHAAIALPVLGVVAVGLSDAMYPASQLVWMGFVIAVSIAMLISYRHAMKKPFERAALKLFAKDLSAILLFAGFAWGSGAFLVLPVGSSAIAALLFALAPAVVVAYLLRDFEALYLFLAPVGSLSLVASFLKPFADGVLAAALVLAGSLIIAGVTLYFRRVTGAASRPAMLSLP